MEANFASERAMKAEPNFYRLQCKYWYYDWTLYNYILKSFLIKGGVKAGFVLTEVINFKWKLWKENFKHISFVLCATNDLMYIQ
jgi:hypothetical protein